MRFNINRILLLVSTLLVSFSAMGQFRTDAGYQDLYDSETGSALKTHIRSLSAAHLEGRKAGSEGEASAAEYVRTAFKGYGVDLLSPEGGDLFGIKTEAGDTLTSRNVIGYVQRGSEPTARDSAFAFEAGNLAVRLLRDGISNQVIGMQKGKVFYMPIDKALKKEKSFNRNLFDLVNSL